MSLDRRHYFRVSPDPAEPVEVQIMGPGFLEIVDALNVCQGGVGVHIPHGMDPAHLGQTVEIILTLPHCRPVHLWGEIRHLDGYNDSCYIGVRFLRIPPKVQAALKRYVYSLRHRPHSPPVGGADTAR